MSHSKGWIGVDLDGTLAHYDTWRGEDHIGEPVPRMIERVHQWLHAGEDVRIFTARVSGQELNQVANAMRVIEEWSIKHIGRKLPITCVKDFKMRELWDDRTIQIVPNQGVRADQLAAETVASRTLRLRNALANFVGAHEPAELLGMRETLLAPEAVKTIPLAEHQRRVADRQRMITAITVLLDTF